MPFSANGLGSRFSLTTLATNNWFQVLKAADDVVAGDTDRGI